MWPLHASIQQTHDIISILSPNMIYIYIQGCSKIHLHVTIYFYLWPKQKIMSSLFPCDENVTRLVYLYPHMTIHAISSNLSFPCMYSLYKFLVFFVQMFLDMFLIFYLHAWKYIIIYYML